MIGAPAYLLSSSEQGSYPPTYSDGGSGMFIAQHGTESPQRDGEQSVPRPSRYLFRGISGATVRSLDRRRHGSEVAVPSAAAREYRHAGNAGGSMHHGVVPAERRTAIGARISQQLTKQNEVSLSRAVPNATADNLLSNLGLTKQT